MHYRPWSFRNIPKDFHAETYKKIATIIERGESLQLFGAPGSGTSVILEVLTQIPEIREQYFSPGKKYHFVLINGNSLLERNSLTLARFFLSSLSHQIDISTDALVINHQIDELINRICKTGVLVIILDQLQELDYPELKPFYMTLKTKHPNFRFIFGTTKRYTQYSDLSNFAQISRLLVQNILVTPPLNREMSLWLIKEEEYQLSIHLKPEECEKIFNLTNGFPRAIKRLMESLARGYSLNQLETRPEEDSVLNLFLEELKIYKDNLLEEIPLLVNFLKRQEFSGIKEQISTITLNKQLTRNEDRILKYLIQNKGIIVEREKGIEAIWGEKVLGVSDHAYDQIIHRLRHKLISANPPCELETVRGRGHVLRIKLSKY